MNWGKKLTENAYADYLFHYTNFGGLKGILENKCLWATDYETMNDSSEFIYGMERLKKALRPKVEELFHEKHPKWIEDKECFGDDPIGSTIDTIFSVLENSYRKYIEGFFVTCFCTVKDPAIDANSEYNIRYIGKNGLLSQWRGYGGSQGFAIEFSKTKIEELVSAYSIICARNVHYIHPEVERSLGKVFTGQYQSIEKMLETILRSGGKDPKLESKLGEDGLRGMWEIMALCKHFGFYEENEYRIALPIYTKEYLKKVEVQEKVAKMGSTLINPHIKTRLSKENILRNYIELFQDSDPKVTDAIKAIIVGPGRHKENNAKKLKVTLEQLGYTHIEVRVSETTFV